MFETPHPGAINLGLGEPDVQPPKRVVEALKKAIDAGMNKYGPTGGILELRQIMAERLSKYADVKPENIIVTTGATEASCLTMQTLIDVGQEVLVPDPGFVLFKPHIRLAGGIPVSYSLKIENKFCPDLDELESLVTSKTKAIIVNSPSNPTGAVFDKNVINSIVDFARRNNLIVISDEVYDEIVYEKSHESFLGKHENLIYINSFSKVFAMTGWRLGYLTAPPEVIKQMAKIHYYMVACPPTPTQYAVIEGIKNSEGFVRKMVKEFQARRDIIVEEVNKIPGFHCLKPEGAFYVFPSYEYDIKSDDMAGYLLNAGVISTPGRAFGEKGEGHIRFSYANSRENIQTAMKRIQKYFDEKFKGKIK